MSLKPMSGQVIIKMVDTDDVTKGGIILTPLSKEVPRIAEVVALPEDVEFLKVGDQVITGKYAGNTIEYEGEKLIAVKVADILAIVED